MILKRIHPRPELAPYIDTMWLFESDHGVPLEDSRVIAPNGKAKIIYPYRNGLSTTFNNLTLHHREQDVYFIGIWDKPLQLSSQANATSTIGIELTPNGLHRFANISFIEVSNRIFSFRDIYGTKGAHLIEALSNTEAPENKANILQSFLADRVGNTERHNPIIDHTVKLIHSSSGLIDLRSLEKKTGYSKRYLDLLFRDHLGISPKTLSNIVRFQSFYRAWANSNVGDFYKDLLSEQYYDQAHFIKEFKRFTGYSPRQYAKEKNEFGRIFYRE
ncbi:MAG: hypothetical protein DI538_24205 [Azospira oryzae]|jgi:AraC-like DNA-binding protein|nr:MAG: hypothetical protein DI538_24205 [Azospira oryzae]